MKIFTVPAIFSEIKITNSSAGFCLVILLMLSASLMAQDLQVEIEHEPTRTFGAILDRASNQIRIQDPQGYEQTAVSYSFIDEEDPSLQVYANAFGSVIRENISNFLWFDAQGSLQHSASNSSQAQGGESMSEWVSDPNQRTHVLFVPKINFDGSIGSSAQIMSKSFQSISLYFSTERMIRDVKVSSDGAFIGLITARESTDDEVLIFDRYGNQLSSWVFNQAVEGIQFSDNGRYHTLYSGGRVAVFDMLTGERLGSSSIRGNAIIAANYLPSQSSIVAITANASTNLQVNQGLLDANKPSLTDLELHTINIEARKVSRSPIVVPQATQLAPLYLVQSTNKVTLYGLDVSLTIR